MRHDRPTSTSTRPPRNPQQNGKLLLDQLGAGRGAISPPSCRWAHTQLKNFRIRCRRAIPTVHPAARRLQPGRCKGGSIPNTKLSNMLQLQAQDHRCTALPLVGHTVQYSDHQEACQRPGDRRYDLPRGGGATITITTRQLQHVLQRRPRPRSGSHSFAWDGRLGGSQVTRRI